MNSIPKWSSNLKYWRQFNRLIFGSNLSCRHCGLIGMQENYRAGYLWCKYCRKKWRWSAAQVGSSNNFLYGCKLQPRTLYQLLWCYLNKKSIDTIKVVTGLSYTTIKRQLEGFRTNIPYDSMQFGRLGGFIKADESYFSKKRRKQGQWIVVGAIDADSKQQKFKITNSRDSEAIDGFMEQHVAVGSTVISDYWTGYTNLEDNGYNHYPFNHDKGEFTHTNQMEGVWSVLKRHIRKTYGRILLRKLPAILNEWEARHNQPELFTEPVIFLGAVLGVSVPG